MSEPQTTTGRYFDGRTARARPVRLRLGERLEIAGEGVRLDWNLLDLRAAETAPPLARIGHADSSGSVEFEDAAFAEALAARCPDLNRRPGRGGLARLVLWSVAAGVSVLLTAIYGVPAAANLLAPLVPPSLEARLGQAVETQIVGLLGDPPACEDPAGKAVLGGLVSRLSATMALVPPQVSVRRSGVANALALPGGRIVILSDIIAKAKSADEFASILAHEFGHVAARDPVRSVIRAGGTSFLLSLVLGDLTGSTVLVAVGQAAISAGYSREAERAADRAAVAAVAQAGGDGRALAAILERITETHDETPGGLTAFLRSHPYTAERAAAIRATPGGKTDGGPLLSEADWRTLRGICGPKGETN